MRTANTINFASYTLNMKGVECPGIIVDGDAIIFKSRAGYACIVLNTDQMKDLREKLEKETKEP